MLSPHVGYEWDEGALRELYDGRITNPDRTPSSQENRGEVQSAN
jgi:hypothetical protein